MKKLVLFLLLTSAAFAQAGVLRTAGHVVKHVAHAVYKVVY